MKRKVIQIADSTQLISLPRKWAIEHNVKKGDELEIEEQGDRVIVSAGKGIKIEKKEIDISGLEPIIPRVLHALYKKGYDEVTIRYNNPELLEPIQKMLHEDLIGYEIVQQEKNYCVIKAIAGAFQTEFDIMLRRTFTMLDSMAKGIVESLKSGDISNIKNLRYLETNNNKFTGFCRRLLNKGGYKDFKNITFIYCTVEELEKVADQYKYLCDYFIKSNRNIRLVSKEIIGLYDELNSLLTGLYEIFYKFDMNKLVDLFKKRKKVVDKSLKILENGSNQETILAHYVLNIVQLLANLLSFKMEIEL